MAVLVLLVKSNLGTEPFQ